MPVVINPVNYKGGCITMVITTSRINSGVIVKEKEKVKRLPTSKVIMNPANVGFGISSTTNIGDFNSIKVSISINVPCQNTDADIDKAYKRVKKLADKKMSKLSKELFKK